LTSIWSYRKSKPEFHFHTYQEHGPWRFALRVGSRAEEVEAPSNDNACRFKGDLSGSPFALSSAGPAICLRRDKMLRVLRATKPRITLSIEYPLSNCPAKFGAASFKQPFGPTNTDSPPFGAVPRITQTGPPLSGARADK
jgi:hypothetical protein